MSCENAGDAREFGFWVTEKNGMGRWRQREKNRPGRRGRMWKARSYQTWKARSRLISIHTSIRTSTYSFTHLLLHPHTHQFIHPLVAKPLSPHHLPTKAPRSRAAPASRRPETASHHVSKEERSDKNHSGDEDEEDNEGYEDNEVSPFTGLVAKLAASKWRLDAVKLRMTFPKSALHSRDFMRQLVSWAEHGEHTFDLMLQAIDETRGTMHQSSDSRRRVPKEDR